MKLDLYGRVDDYMQENVRWALKQAERDNDEELTCYVNSGGGSVFAGNAIWSMIKRFKGKKICYVDSLAASMMSVIPMAFDKVYISPLTNVMIHDPLTLTVGNKKAHHNSVKVLDSIKSNMIIAYDKKLNATKEEIDEIMSEETWYNAEEAVAIGWADGIIEDEDVIEASFDPLDYVAELESYKNVPEEIKNKLGLNNDNSNREESVNMPAKKNGETEAISGIEVAQMVTDHKSEIAELETAHKGVVEGLKGEIGKLEGSVTDLEGKLKTSEDLVAEKDTKIGDLTAEIEKGKKEKETAEAKKVFAEKFPNFKGDALDEKFNALQEVKEAGLENAALKMEESYKKENSFLASDNKLFNADGDEGDSVDGEYTDEKVDSMIEAYKKEHKCSHLDATTAVAKIVQPKK